MYAASQMSRDKVNMTVYVRDPQQDRLDWIDEQNKNIGNEDSENRIELIEQDSHAMKTTREKDDDEFEFRKKRREYEAIGKGRIRWFQE